MFKQYASLELNEHSALFRIIRIREDAKILSDKTFQYDVSLARIDAPVSRLFAEEIDILDFQGTPYLFGSDASEIIQKGYIEILSVRAESVTVKHSAVPKEEVYGLLLQNMAEVSFHLLKKSWDRLDDSANIEDTEIALAVPESPPSGFCLERFYLNNIKKYEIDEYGVTIYTSFVGEWNSILFEEQPAIWKLISKRDKTLYIQFDSLFLDTFHDIFDYDDSNEEKSQNADRIAIPAGFDYDSYLLFQIMKNIEDTSFEDAKDLKDDIFDCGIFGKIRRKVAKEDEKLIERSVRVLNSRLAATLAKTLKPRDISMERFVLVGDRNTLLSAEDMEKISDVVLCKEN